jgi:hypothetical protein
MRLLAIVLLTVVILPALAIAGDKPPKFTIWGIGNKTCAEFGKLYRHDPEMAENVFFSWAQGYLSGANAGRVVLGGADDIDAGSVDEQQRFLRTYCDEHPLAEYNIAVSALLDKLIQSTISKGPNVSR